jgi:hypothetical protein
MSELLREQAQFRKGKTPIVAKYSQDHAAMMAEIAGRGFSRLPGYAYSMENQLEIAMKMGLSELNAKILTETIERELKQSGIDYDHAVKTAVLAWELEKQGLLDDWAAEYAGIKRGMASDEETLNLLAIEVGKRAISLMNAKTAIEISMEAYRKQLAELEDDTSPYEIQLANAKLLTAQKKLELIPVIEEIIEKEQELLVIEQGKTAAYGTYMAAEQALAAKKQTLAPFINDLANATESYASKIEDVELPVTEQLEDERIAQSEAAVEKAGYQVTELTTEISTEQKSLTVMANKRALQGVQFENEQALIEAETSLDGTYHESKSASFEDLLQQERSAAEAVITDKGTIHTKQSGTRKTSSTTITDEEIEMANETTLAENTERMRVAEINAIPKITATLNHLIGNE